MYNCQKCHKQFDRAVTMKDELCGGIMQVCPFCNCRVYARRSFLRALRDFWFHFRKEK